MVLLLMLSVPLGWVAYKRKQTCTQREAAKAIQRLGGAVGYDFERETERYSLRGIVSTNWLRDELFGYVTLVYFTDAQFDGTGLEHLESLTHLEYLLLWDTHVCDKHLVHIQGLTQLRHLDLSGTKVTDAGLVHLRGPSQLEFLNLRHTQVTNAGAGELQKALPNCKIYR